METEDEEEAEAGDGMQKLFFFFFFFPLEPEETVDLELFQETFYISI